MCFELVNACRDLDSITTVGPWSTPRITAISSTSTSTRSEVTSNCPRMPSIGQPEFRKEIDTEAKACDLGGIVWDRRQHGNVKVGHSNAIGVLSKGRGIVKVCKIKKKTRTLT